jgi:hypothetical protein
MLELIDAGWELGEFSSTGAVFFCTRGTERRMVNITPTAPSPRGTRGAADLSARPEQDD